MAEKDKKRNQHQATSLPIQEEEVKRQLESQSADELRSVCQDWVYDSAYLASMAAKSEGAKEQPPSGPGGHLSGLIYEKNYVNSLIYDLTNSPEHKRRVEYARRSLIKIDEAKREAEKIYERCKTSARPDFSGFHEQVTLSSQTIALLIDHAQHMVKVERAKAGGLAKAMKTQEAKDFVLTEWARDGVKYPSKADFARIMSDVILTRFEIKVGARQIETKWLPKTGGRKKSS